MKTKVIDISWPITNFMTAYKDKRTVEVEQLKSFDDDGVRESKLTLGSHTGTHVDAPAHFLKDGATLDNMRLERLMGSATVLDLTYCVETISVDDLEKIGATDLVAPQDIVLLKTKNSECQPDASFWYDFVYVDQGAAEYLVNLGIKAIGIDYLGIERNQPDHETHAIFMRADIPIIEGLRLLHVEQGHYSCVCLPLHVVGVEAAPARAVLIDEEEV